MARPAALTPAGKDVLCKLWQGRGLGVRRAGTQRQVEDEALGRVSREEGQPREFLLEGQARGLGDGPVGDGSEVLWRGAEDVEAERGVSAERLEEGEEREQVRFGARAGFSAHAEDAEREVVQERGEARGEGDVVEDEDAQGVSQGEVGQGALG